MEDQNGTIIHIRAEKTTVMVPESSNCIFFDKDTVELEGTHIPHGHLFQLLINLGEWSMGRRN